MRATGLFFIGALAGAGAFALATNVLQRSEPAQVAAEDDARKNELRMHRPAWPNGDAPARRPKAREQQEEAPAEQRMTDAGAARDVFEPDPDTDWNALVGGMLEWEVEHRTGRELTAEKRERLATELARLREASLTLQEAPVDPDDPAEVRERLIRTLTLVQVDQAFRNELGIGVAEFLEGVDSNAVEDVPPAPNDQ